MLAEDSFGKHFLCHKTNSAPPLHLLHLRLIISDLCKNCLHLCLHLCCTYGCTCPAPSCCINIHLTAYLCKNGAFTPRNAGKKAIRLDFLLQVPVFFQNPFLFFQKACVFFHQLALIKLYIYAFALFSGFDSQSMLPFRESVCPGAA